MSKPNYFLMNLALAGALAAQMLNGNVPKLPSAGASEVNPVQQVEAINLNFSKAPQKAKARKLKVKAPTPKIVRLARTIARH